MIFGRSKKRTADLPMTSAEAVSTTGEQPGTNGGTAGDARTASAGGAAVSDAGAAAEARTGATAAGAAATTATGAEADTTAPDVSTTRSDDPDTSASAEAGVAATDAVGADDTTGVDDVDAAATEVTSTDAAGADDPAATTTGADTTGADTTGVDETYTGANESAPTITSEETAPVQVLDRTEHGPRDVSEIESRDQYLDLGAILIRPVEGVVLRLEVQEATDRVLAAILDLGESSVQLQAFAAPRTLGIWDEIREQIAAAVVGQQGQANEVRSHFGTELLAAVPAVAGADAGLRVARFIGIDGPRWFLRGVITGAAATDPEAAEGIERLFRDVVVVRGAEAMAPRDLLPLVLPGMDDAGNGEDGPILPTPPERGPEVTQIG